MYKIYAGVLLFGEAKNVGDAAHRRSFLTKLGGKGQVKMYNLLWTHS